MPTAQSLRDYVAVSSLLELSAAFAGQLVSVEGGDAVADVIEEQPGSDSVVRKHIAGVRYSDIELECGAGMEGTFFDWIEDLLTHRFTRRSGAISFVGFNSGAQSRLEFFDALVTGIDFPALDVGSKDAVTMTVKLTPESTRRQKGSGQPQPASVGAKGRAASWTAANFRLRIDGLDCTHVSNIEPLAFTTAVAETGVGEVRDYQLAPARLEVPDLVLTLSESHAATFHAWHEDFVVKGMNGPEYEKNGTLELLGPNRLDVLLTLQFKNLGIFKLASMNPAASENIARVRASMYCEEITFGTKTIAPPATAPAPSGPAPAAAPPTAEAPIGRIVTAEFPREFTSLRTAVDLQNDPRNCGRIGNDITNLYPNATALCVGGQPQMGPCNPGWVDADGIAANGCELFTDDHVGTVPNAATVLGTLHRGNSLTFTGLRGPSKPAWFLVTMPYTDNSVAHFRMTSGHAFTVYGQSFQTSPLATDVTIYDVPLSPALTQFFVNVPEGPWARYTLAISRE